MTLRPLRPLAVAALLVLAGQPALARNLAPAYPSLFTLIAEPAPGGDPLIGLIGQARSRLLVETTAINDEPVVAALAAARARGVDVRVMADPHSASSGAALARLERQDVWWRRGNQAYKLTGETAVVLDGSTLAVATAPLTGKARTTMRRFLLVDHDPRDVQQGASVFYDDWERRTPSRFAARTLLAPVDYQLGVVEAINSATRTLDIMSESLDSPSVLQAVNGAALRQVQVRVLLDPGAARGVVQDLAGAGAEPRLLNLGFAGSALSIDGGRLLIGSAALSDVSLGQQRELGLLIDDSGAAAAFRGTFDSDWGAAQKLVITSPTVTPPPPTQPPPPTATTNPHASPRPTPRPSATPPPATPPPPLTATPSALTLTPSYLGSVRVGGIQRIVVSTLAGAVVTITVTYPDGSTRNDGTRQGLADANGFFRDQWTLAPTTQPGQAHATIVVSRAGKTQTISIAFTITL